MSPERLRRTDKFGESFEIGIARADDLPSVQGMYCIFSPKPGSQGLPPEDPEKCQDWVRTLFEIGVNGLAWRSDSVIGHVALIPNVRFESGELVIFVHQDHRNLRIGTELAKFTLEKFAQLGFGVAWLTVRVTNFIAIKLYRNLGFDFCDTDSYERVMAIKLR